MSFLLEFALILIAVKLAGQASRLLGQPSVLGKLMVGLLLGPALLGWIHPTPMIAELAEVGVILLMFLAGLETHLGDFRRNALAATLVAVGGVILPFLGGWLTAWAWGFHGPTAVFAGVLLVATSVSISAQTLRELGHLRSRTGVTVLAAAVLDDVLGIIVLSAVLGLVGGDAANAGGGHGADPVWLLLVKMLLFFAGTAVVGWKILPPLLRIVARFQVTAPLLAAGVAAALGFAYTAEWVGLAGIIGSYLAGLSLSGTEFRERLLEEVEQTALGVFVPFFFVSVGLSANFKGLSGTFLLFVAALTLVAILTKIVGSGAGALLAGFDLRSAAATGSGMVARGEVGLIVAAIGLQRGLLSNDLYTAMVMVSLVTTLATPPLLKLILKPVE